MSPSFSTHDLSARKLSEFTYDPARCSFKTWLLNLTTWRIKDRRGAGSRPGGRTIGIAVGGGLQKSRPPSALQRIKAQANLKDCPMFELYVLRQWPAREVARTLGVSVARVYLAKHRIAPLVKKQIVQLESQKI